MQARLVFHSLRCCPYAHLTQLRSVTTRSGCITSAETVLLEHQSVDELLTALSSDSPFSAVVVSLSPQSSASLAATLRVSPTVAGEALRSLFASLGVAAVVDTAAFRELSLLETGAELVNRLSPPPGATASPSPLPLLACACPGWVCYVEKHKDAELLLRHASRVKSPQAVAGTLVKRLWAARRGVAPERVYHCSVMPCYDKKLEAARDDLRTPCGAAETDCVLTTGEVLAELLRGQQRGSASQPHDSSPPQHHAAPARPLPMPVDDDAIWSEAGCVAPGGGSGGYAHAAAVAATTALWGAAYTHLGPLPWTKRGAGDDFREAVLTPPSGCGSGRVLRFAAVYGFRNITTLVRMLKRGSAGGGGGGSAAPYDYVEVMACPSGCLNGGGQAKPEAGPLDEAPMTHKQALEAADKAYYGAESSSGAGERASPGGHPLVGATYAWLGGGVGGDAARAVLHTELHARSRNAVAALQNW